MHVVDGLFQMSESAANCGGNRRIDVRCASKSSSSSSAGMMVASCVSVVPINAAKAANMGWRQRAGVWEERLGCHGEGGGHTGSE